MTKRKEHPAKRGRKALQRGVLEQVHLRWRSALRDERHQESPRKIRSIANEFISKQQGWFVSLGISISNYGTLRNVVVAGARERRLRRQQSWGIVTDWRGKRSLKADGQYLNYAALKAFEAAGHYTGGAIKLHLKDPN